MGREIAGEGAWGVMMIYNSMKLPNPIVPLH